MIGNSTAVESLLNKVPAVAKAKRTTLISGPTGSGKEVLARLLHEKGCGLDAPFVPVNCSAIPEELIESELFGHAKGAFTGAGSRKGLISAAQNGVLFLDEINSANLALQAKLLRFLESKEIRPVGSDCSKIASGVWVLAATNKDLEDGVRNGNFREDLMYRINVITLEIPPLSARKSDIDLLCQYFLEQLGAGKHHFSEAARYKLRQHHWPGNVRELKHCIEKAVIFSESPEISADQISLPRRREHTESVTKTALRNSLSASETVVDLWQLVENKGLSLAEAMALCEQKLICAALRAENNNRSRAAQRLGIHNRTIFKKLSSLPDFLVK